jgi:hypothetical protein
MEPLPPIDRNAFKGAVREKMERLLDEVCDAVDGAEPGRVIRDSEEPVRDAFARLRQEVYEEAMQRKVDAAEAAFPPSGQRQGREEETA